VLCVVYIYDNISLNSSQNKNVSDKSCRERQNTSYVFSKVFPENRIVYEKMWKGIVQPDRPRMTVEYGACALHAGQLRQEYTRTHNF
jgi:NADH:ubiquinone oxidoreductase subunit B-like Fe-S oxidoreductase